MSSGRSATTSAKSTGSPPASGATRSFAHCPIFVSRSATARGVNALVSRPRSRVWSGGSVLSIIRRT
ncbi:hypothetical protein [Saccharothrix espanaensis]